MKDLSTPPMSIDTDGRTVWVNGAYGCLGRFGVAGIDIHRSVEEQRAGQGECLYCTHVELGKETTLKDWEIFVEKMREFYGIKISRRYMPTRFCVEESFLRVLTGGTWH